MKFEQRFNIEIAMEEAQKRFVNRTYNKILLSFYLNLGDDTRYQEPNCIASNGRFWKKGAELLDRKLVDHVLLWLRRPGLRVFCLPTKRD